jgi:pyruvate dehydrogenase E2 component (dihydrolipoamide acetyltransferase)
MAETIAMPKLGFDMAEGTLVRWVKNEGEAINKGDVLAEIETDKATVEVESSASGVVLKHLVDEGAVVPVSTPIAVVGEEGEEVSEQPAEAEAEAEPVETAPKAEDEPARGKAEAQPARAEPFDQAQGRPAPAKPAEAAPKAVPTDGRIQASPLARRMAEEENLDLRDIQGTGPGGRIVRRDIEEAMEKGVAAPVPEKPAEKAPAMAPLPAFQAESREDETVPLTRLRQAIARRMTESATTVPHFFVTHENKMNALLDMRKQINEYLPENEKLSVNDFILKAVALTLRQFPNLNASYAGDKVIRHGAVNVGVAVAVEGGLLTVVNKNTDQKPLRQISAEVKQMVSRAREGKVKPEDIEGSTFSVSNMGMFDVEHFIAIINPPEAAILAVGSAMEVPVVENGAIVPGWRMKATLSVDHRVSDGAEGARFMQALAEFLENPVRMLV